jgi:hypothetical protein
MGLVLQVHCSLDAAQHFLSEFVIVGWDIINGMLQLKFNAEFSDCLNNIGDNHLNLA